MLYENYQNKIKKIADVLRKMLRMWPLVLLGVLIIVAAISAFFVTKGMIISVDCPSSVTYGDRINCKAKAFLSKTHIEYSDGSGNWSEEAPIMPGEYKLRAVGRGVFGAEKTGDAISFTIEKKAITIHSKDGTINYGEHPVLSADLAYEDKLYCEEFEFGDIFLRSDDEISDSSHLNYEVCVSATPVKSSIVIKDKNGNDVSLAYDISVSKEDLKIIPRKITVTVEDASKKYDGIRLAFDGYELSGGELAEGDTLYAYFNKYIVDVGTVENTPELVLISDKGVDVTLCYDITVVKGTLTVEKRPLVITTGGGEFTYDGMAHTVETYEISRDTPLAQGQILLLTWNGATDAGVLKNIPGVRIEKNDGSEVTHNYSVFFEAGELKVNPLPITVSTLSATVEYDGYPHMFTEFGFVVTSGKLLYMHDIWASDSGFAEEVGVYENDISVTIYDIRTGNEVTHNYSITYEYGTVEIKKRLVKIFTNSESWVYDGEAHYNEGFFHSGVSYKDTIVVTERTEITDVGRDENRLSVKIGRFTYIYEEDIPNLDGNLPGVTSDESDGTDNNVDNSESKFRDMSHNYEIIMVYGTIKILPRPVELKPVDAKKVYDGTPLIATAVEVSSASSYSMVEGHTVTSFQTTGSLIDVGSKTNYIVEGSVKISDASGANVTRNYDISLTFGTLTVVPREILIETGSASKKYDGMPLTNGDFGISASSPNQLVEGHSLYVENIGKITDPGKTENICNLEATRVYDANGRDVTSNYLATYAYGILEVYEDQHAGSDGDIGLGEGDETPEVHLRVKDEQNGFLYLRRKSFGGYTGKGWNEATEYSALIDGIYSANYLSALALGQTSYNLEIEVLVGQYFLPYYLSTETKGDYEIQESDTVYRGDASKIYSAPYKNYDYKSKKELPSKYAEFEKAYRSFVYSQYLIVDAETREYMERIIKAQSFVGNDIETILRVVMYIQNSARYDREYDRALDDEENIAIAFLETYREGICQHYATAATLLFRTMGIPARYTVGYVADTVEGEWVDVTSENAHAWVEVYIDGMGWIEVEVTGGDGFGLNGSGGSIPKETLTVKPVYQFKKYDGKALYAISEIEHDTLLADLVKRGYRYYVQVSGEQIEVGIGASVPSDFVLYDPLGNDVTDDYNIVYENGVLEVIAPDVTVINIELYQLQKYYDGKPISFEEGDYFVHTENLSPEINISVKLNISLTEVGCITLSDLNENIGEYLTYEIKGGDPAYFKFVFVKPETTPSWGGPIIGGVDDFISSGIVSGPVLAGSGNGYIPIRVDARQLTITASSATKVYDGEYLTSDESYITKGSLCDGHTLTVTLSGSIKRPGEEVNGISSIIILDENEVNVTHNYKITAVEGLLTVTE